MRQRTQARDLLRFCRDLRADLIAIDKELNSLVSRTKATDSQSIQQAISLLISFVDTRSETSSNGPIFFNVNDARKRAELTDALILSMLVRLKQQRGRSAADTSGAL